MSGYRIKQTVLMVIGLVIGIYLANNHQVMFPGKQFAPTSLQDYAFFGGIGIGLGALIAYITGGSDDKPSGGTGT